MSAPLKDFPQTLKESYDPALERLRVDAIINDGVDALIINPDGSLNVNVVSSEASSGNYKSIFAEISSVASSIQTNIQTYVVPLGKIAFLQKIDCAGTNIAKYEVLVNGIVQSRMYTYFGSALNDTFEFADFSESGYPLTAGDSVTIRVEHFRPFIGDFNARIQVTEI